MTVATLVSDIREIREDIKDIRKEMNHELISLHKEIKLIWLIGSLIVVTDVGAVLTSIF